MTGTKARPEIRSFAEWNATGTTATICEALVGTASDADQTTVKATDDVIKAAAAASIVAVMDETATRTRPGLKPRCGRDRGQNKALADEAAIAATATADKAAVRAKPLWTRHWPNLWLPWTQPWTSSQPWQTMPRQQPRSRPTEATAIVVKAAAIVVPWPLWMRPRPEQGSG